MRMNCEVLVTKALSRDLHIRILITGSHLRAVLKRLGTMSGSSGLVKLSDKLLSDVCILPCIACWLCML